MFHKHKWVKIKETYAPPVKQGKYWTVREAIELQTGITTILLKCSVCSKLHKEEMLGAGTRGKNENI